MEAFSWSTKSTALAAAFGACGFPIRTNVTEIIELRPAFKLRFFIAAQSQWLARERNPLREAHLTGELVKADPLHPFLQALRAAHNYAVLLGVQKTGTRVRLAQVPDAQAWHYAPGEEDARLRLMPGPRTNDLPLAAACGVVGIPVVDIEGEQGRRLYRLAARGLRSIELPQPEWETLHLIRRQQPGKPALALEQSEPQHPLCAAYQAAHDFVKLTKHLKHRHPRAVILRAPGSHRRALVMEHASDRVLDKVRRHFGVAE
jgi:hypothetical protein